MSSVYNLPIELWMHVFDFLDINDTKKLAPYFKIPDGYVRLRKKIAKEEQKRHKVSKRRYITIHHNSAGFANPHRVRLPGPYRYLESGLYQLQFTNTDTNDQLTISYTPRIDTYYI